MEVAAAPVPEPAGGRAVVVTIDQKDKERVVRAANYSNPRWLEWGGAYRPIPGDSGSGVFVRRKEADGSETLVLIGNVVVRSEKGGGAGLWSAARAVGLPTPSAINPHLSLRERSAAKAAG